MFRLNVGKSVVTLLILVCHFLSAAQSQPEVIPPYSQNIIINDLCFNQHEDKLLTVSLDGSIVVWDIRTQTSIKKIQAHRAEVSTIAFSNKGDRFITAGMDSTVRVWDSETYEPIRTIPTRDLNLSANWSADDSMIVTSGASGLIQVYNADTYKFIEGLIASESKVNVVHFFRGNQMVITGSEDGHVKLFLRGSGKIGMDLPMESPVKKITLDKAQGALAIHTVKGMADIILVPSMESYGALKVPTKNYFNQLDYVSQMDMNSYNSLFAYVDNERYINIADPVSKLSQRFIPEHKGFISKVKFSNSGKYLASLDHHQRIYITDLRSFDVKKSTYLPMRLLKPVADYPNKVMFWNDTTITFTGAGLYAWNMHTGKIDDMMIGANYEFFEKHFKKGKYKKLEYRYSLKYGLVVYKNKDAFDVVPQKHRAISKDQKKLLFYVDKQWYVIQEGIPLQKLKLDFNPEHFEKIIIDNDGSISYIKKNKVELYDANGERLWDKHIDFSASDIDSDQNGNLLISTFNDQLILCNRESAEMRYIKTEDAQSYHSAFINNKTVVTIGKDNVMRFIDLRTGNVHAVTSLELSGIHEISVDSKGENIAITTTDRSVQLFKYEKFKTKRLFQVFALFENGVLVLNESGYYMSTKSAYKKMSFLYKKDVHPLEQFDGLLNQPHKVLSDSPIASEEILTVMKKAYEKNSSKNNSTPLARIKSLPKIQIQKKSGYSNVVQNEDLLLELRLDAGINPIQSFQIFINDVPYFSTKGMKTDQTTIKQHIKLLPGRNKISCIATDSKGLSSLSDDIQITLEQPDKPTLYMVSIGVSEYQNSSFNLDYAAKDATDINDLMKSSKVYKETKELVVLNQDVNQNTLEDVKAFIKGAKHNDVVIFFIAGHGTLDASYDYYFAGHDMDFENPSAKGFSFKDIQSVFDGIKCLRKILLMDTCHSGEVDKDAIVSAGDIQEVSNLTFRSSGSKAICSSAEKKVISDMASSLFLNTSKATGATIISSSGGTEVARESDEWKNGLFTFFFKKGILSMKADYNQDGQLMLSEIQNYVNENVALHSNGKQRPTARNLNLAMDYRLF
jgi:WD40 repeat protein